MAFITIDGQNHIAKKQGDKEQLNITSFVLANVPNLGSEPATRIETIPNSYVVDQLPVTKSGYVNPNQVVYSLVMGSNIGSYEFNWVGLVDDDGVLIAVTYIPLTTKTKNDGAKAGNTFTRNFLIYYTGIQHTTLVNVPAETWQIDFSTRLSGIDERERLSNLDIYGHEGFLGDGWKVTGSAGTYNVVSGVGYVGGIRIKNAEAQEITTTTFPNEIWLNVSLQGDISDMTAVTEFVIDTGPFDDYVDANNYGHHLVKLATLDSNGRVTDNRIIYENVAQHEAKDDPHHQYKVYAEEQANKALLDAAEDAKAKMELYGYGTSGSSLPKIEDFDTLLVGDLANGQILRFDQGSLNAPASGIGVVSVKMYTSTGGSIELDYHQLNRRFIRFVTSNVWSNFVEVMTTKGKAEHDDVSSGSNSNLYVTPKSLFDAGVKSELGVEQDLKSVSYSLNTIYQNLGKKMKGFWIYFETISTAVNDAVEITEDPDDSESWHAVARRSQNSELNTLIVIPVGYFFRIKTAYKSISEIS
ncbi:phage tail protein [Marinomonas aquiplantarum]|uniref:Tail-collar fiber protein n=1 Tax=Marinomonas aquiplantarum TaxID=491951 RepID=A0A366D045_9GAMM|nr:phage tail protein [Marinomonas aquiplantarum]RBO83442.1 tail-collar fiber protein [Marinomonas aquiplantarum]